MHLKGTLDPFFCLRTLNHIRILSMNNRNTNPVFLGTVLYSERVGGFAASSACLPLNYRTTEKPKQHPVPCPLTTANLAKLTLMLSERLLFFARVRTKNYPRLSV